ncbi:peptidase M15 [Thermococci archaeon]|nr:MAG: peptidase M15 [Thermococci archaeon]RLI48604.1 MAG: peptidase M15 [Candidatus Thorarchaeota archaeon]
MNKNFWSLIKHFSEDEFKCPCCGRCDMNPGFVFMLDTLREILGTPLVITSGFRCAKHNREIGGKENSAHLKGLAADILCVNSAHRYELIKHALALGFRRIGIGKDFIHLDYDKEKPQGVIWVY